MEPTTVPKYFTLSRKAMGILVVIKDGLLFPVGSSALIGEGLAAFVLLLVRGIISKIIDISEVNPLPNDADLNDRQATGQE